MLVLRLYIIQSTTYTSLSLDDLSYVFCKNFLVEIKLLKKNLMEEIINNNPRSAFIPSTHTYNYRIAEYYKGYKVRQKKCL